jgi:F-type H+-transporting ATPase subunit gamma
MESSESLRKAVAVTQELQAVVKTMKALAGVNIRQYERAAHAIAEYDRVVEMGLQVVLQRMRANAMPPLHPSGRKLGAVIFGSDQGMCGQLNDRVVSHAARALGKLAARRESQVVLAVVGSRAAAQLDTLGRPAEAVIRVPWSTFGITTAVEEVLETIDDWYTKREIEFVVLFYARPVAGAWYRIRGIRLLPLDAEWINGLKARHWPSRVLPTFTMNETRLFRRLVREYLFVSLFRAFTESMSSENASRLAAMQMAERHIDDHLHALTSESRRFRQTAITSELLDIITSFEAMRGQEKY